MGYWWPLMGYCAYEGIVFILFPEARIAGCGAEFNYLAFALC
jgi:hypothetical protein